MAEKTEGGARTRGQTRESSPEKPLVTVITAVLNGERNIEQAITSVLAQTYDNVEYIIIDGGSTDGTVEIIRRYDDRIDYWLSEPDRGISDAFNKGIACSNGDIIGILNSDDWYEPECVMEIVDHYPYADVIHGNLQYWDRGQKTYVFTASHDFLPKEMTVNHPTVFVRRGVYGRLGLFKTNYKYAMDYEALLRFYLAGTRFFYIDKVLANMRMKGLTDAYWYRAYGESMTAKNENTGKTFLPFLYFVMQLARTSLSRFFDRPGLSWIRAGYRRRYAPVRKRYEKEKNTGR